MRIVCDACQAKYSISDDKVVGKVFKIRCKKCSNVIVVRGNAGAAEAPAPAPAPPADEPSDAVWHLVIDQDQVGPLAIADVQRRLAAGEIDADTFAWREGMSDWLPVAQVGELAPLLGERTTVGASDPAAALAAAPPREDSSDDLFAAAAPARGGNAGDLAGDLGSYAGEAATMAGSPSARLRGERNESSVLFSLNNLAQIANKPAPAPVAASSGSASGPGMEGSGLIDIRSMASAYMGASGAATAKPATSGSIGSIDDLPVFGGGGFSEPAVIVPTARPASNQKLMLVMIAALGLLAVIAIVMVVILLKSGKSTDATPTDKVAALGSDTSDKLAKQPDTKQPDTKQPDVKQPDAKQPDEKQPDVKQPDVKQPDVKQPDTKQPDTKQPDTKQPDKLPAKHDPPKHVDAQPKHVDTKQPDPPKQKDAKDDCDQVACVVNGYEGACCQKFRTGQAAPKKPPPPSDLPDSLDVGMIQAGIGTIKARAMQCGDKSPARGKVKVHLKVEGDGRVSASNAESAPDSALGACVVAATSKATFAKTQHGRSFSYVFTF